jgi:hypothetical protein
VQPVAQGSWNGGLCDQKHSSSRALVPQGMPVIPISQPWKGSLPAPHKKGLNTV